MRAYLWVILSLAFGLAAAAVEAGPVTFDYTGAVVDYTVPTDGRYAVKVSGAQGGGFPSNFIFGGTGKGGLGATIGGSVYLHQGDTLQVAVGEQGGIGDCHCNYEGGSTGGGGGSFLVRDNGGIYVPLAIAGGGGGAAYDDNSSGGAGQAGQMGGAAGCGATTTAGNGGAVSTCKPWGYPSSAGGGGGGFYTSGASYDNAPGFVSPGGGSFLTGLAGGQGPSGVEGNGGFGGGGGSFGRSGGGGGGYTGGGGGGGYTQPSGFYDQAVNNMAGGGGGSYFTASGIQTIAISGDHGGDGAITIARFEGANGSFAASAQPGNAVGAATANVAWDTTADLSAYKLIGAPIPISGKFTVNGKVQFVAPYTNIWDMGRYTMLLEDDDGDVVYSTDFDTFDQRQLVYGGETVMFDVSQTIDILTAFNPAADFDFSMPPSLHAKVVLHNVADLGYLGWSLNDLSISGQLQMGYIATDHVALPGEDGPENVPEPAMLGLFGLGAIGLGLSRRRLANAGTQRLEEEVGSGK